MKGRSEVAVVLMMAGLLAPARVLLGQQQSPPTPDPACACHEEPEEPGEPGGGGGTNLALIGVAGLAILSGLPFGATTLQGLPFAAGPEAPGLPGIQVAVPDTPQPLPEQGNVAQAPPVVLPGEQRQATPELPEIVRAGVVAPKTATHLPLLAALGALMVGSGGLLARRKARDRKGKRRRFVSL